MKYIIKRNNQDYVIKTDEKGNGGYNVVPKDIDPYNLYTIEEVENYLKEHPGDLLNFEELEKEKVALQCRAERDQKIQEVEWRVNRHNQELELDLTPTEELRPLLEYIQALRDIPQQEGFPNNVEWPIVPEVLQGE